MIPTSAQANAGQRVSAWAFKVALAAPAVIPVKDDAGVKKSIYMSASSHEVKEGDVLDIG